MATFDLFDGGIKHLWTRRLRPGVHKVLCKRGAVAWIIWHATEENRVKWDVHLWDRENNRLKPGEIGFNTMGDALKWVAETVPRKSLL